MDVHFAVDDEVLSVSSDLLEHTPPEQRGCARVLVHRRKDGSFTEAKLRDLPALLEKYETWINVSRARSKTLPITLASAHQLTMRLVRGAGAESVYCIEGPLELIEGAQAWTSTGARIQIKAQYKGFQSLYRADIQGGNATHYHENGAPIRDGEGLMARVYGSVYDDGSAAHLDAPTLAALNVRRLAYHQDFSGYESIPADELDAFDPHPEEYALLDPFTRAFRCAVGLPALKALETAARGELDGECGLFIRPPFDFRGADAWLVPLPLPSETTFYALSAFVGGHEAACGIVRKAVEGKFRFYKYGDLLLVI
jgi:S-adenosylmethionine:tRNA ribosyltransferase-isomerase